MENIKMYKRSNMYVWACRHIARFATTEERIEYFECVNRSIVFDKFSNEKHGNVTAFDEDDVYVFLGDMKGNAYYLVS